MTSFSFFRSNADSASSTPAMKLDSIGIESFNFGSTAPTAGSFTYGFPPPTSAVDHSPVCCSKIKHGMRKRGCKCRRTPPSRKYDALLFPVQTFTPSFAFGSTVSPYGLSPSSALAASSSSSEVLFPSFALAASSSSSEVSSETKSAADEIKQNSATRKANKEPVTNSPLQLALVSRILNGIPQNPHFYQLRDYSELTRKKLMFAWDQIFEETVKEIQSLQTVDFWVRAKMLWKTMEELQNLGYTVIALRKRLVELTDVMLELKLSQSVIKGLKINAENHRMEKSRLECLIVNFQAMAKREEDSMEDKLILAAKLANDLPKFEAAFAKLAMDTL